MKQALWTTVILVVIGWVVFFPKHDEVLTVDSSSIKIVYYDVEVRGEVAIPSKIRLFESITMHELILMCGGFTEDADLSRINLSEVITSNRQITIDTIHQDQLSPHLLVNINQASFKELLMIPGITETRAASIIIYREAHGSFKHIDELIHVKNIGPATLEKIKPYIKI